MTYRHPIRSGKLSWSASAAYLRHTFDLLPDGKGNEAFLVFQDVNVNSSGPTGGGNATVTIEPASIGALSLEAGIGYRFGRRLHLDLSAGAGYLLASELNTVAQVLPIGAGNRGVQFQSTLAEVDTGFDPSLRRWQPVVGASVSYAPLARWSVRAGYRYRPLDLFSAPGYRAPRSSFRLGVGFRIR